MGHIVLPFIEAIVSFIVIAATGMTGVSLWLRYRAQNRPELDGGAVEDLREENVELRSRLAELEERVDFVERRMIHEHPPQPSQPPEPPLRLPQQPERTPA